MSASDIEATSKQKVEQYFRPPVDIVETKDALTLFAEMPGVPAAGVEVHLEGDELTVEGRVRPADYEGLKPLHVEYGVGGYSRRFTLGESIDREGIAARVQGGVLELRLPKTDHARVRRIDVRSA
jgi:HSP20 family molecular chaperone IbpA